jgi:hypothetical protein
MTGALVHYDAMCTAIAAAHRVDEVKDLRDQAMALAAAARIAGNTEAEDTCYEIRRRAERQLGKLMAQQAKEVGKAKGGAHQHSANRGNQNPNSPPTLAEAGIGDKNLAKDARALAAVPERQFQAAFAEGGRPSVAEITGRPKPPPRSHNSSVALWVWGRLLDFERNGVLATPPAEALAEMHDHQIEDVNEKMAEVIEWLSRLLALAQKRGH